MRNLTLIATESSSFANLNLTSTAIDLDENVIYAASEQQTLDGEVAVELWRVAHLNGDHTVQCFLSLRCLNSTIVRYLRRQ
jgi:elongator complex protein 1